jgi:type II secretory pathway component PulM
VNARDAWLASWRQRPSRERALVALATLVVGGAAVHGFLYRPLADDRAEVERAATQARLDVATARRLADEVAGLVRAPRTPPTADLRAAAMRVVAAAGLKDALTAIDASDGRVRVTFADVGVEAFAAFVDLAGREELLFPAEVLLAARVTPGQVRAEASFARPAAAR